MTQHKTLDKVIDKEYIEYTRKAILCEVPVLRSLRKHYQRKGYYNKYNLNIDDALYISVMNHGEGMRKWYEKKYLPQKYKDVIYR